jgi:hypothetical protein
MSTFVTLTNLVLTRLNEVTLDTAGDGFTTARGVQAIAKDAVNNAIRQILHNGQEWPFQKTTYTQTMTSGTREYDFPADYSSPDYESFYLKKTDNQQGTYLPPLTYEEYIQNHRQSDDNGATGAPVYVYQTYGNSFGISPTPDSSTYEVEYTYWSYPTELTAYDDSNVIPQRWDYVVVEGALVDMMRHRSNSDNAMMHLQSFQEGIREMRRVLLDEEPRVTSTMIEGKRVAR